MGRSKSFDPEMKYCPSCKTYKNRIADFYQIKGRPSGDKYCKDCAKLDVRARKYELTISELQRLLEVTRCEICGEELKDSYSKKIDHNHVTGNIRGVLCTRCNTGLGKFLESPELLEKAADYLRER